ncbi:hypothetical protein L6164_025859 [Bauhinia variegata]|uniref:Uncharacterized protein n=1 Tax=Bauhinia variegata TaxID=167791 RepID=A0ACB9M5H4_BAUVA|nr:hypothetical protein L6164_025859 [Bauhinia variegata]
MTMSSSTRLDSVVFQLTPTRTRCDLVITVNGKKEKIASGLFNPFLSHLKAARDQMAKGGYSIILDPEHGDDTSWFTRGTVERFVRFVSTPEILERVHTIESEISQIEEAIAIQGNNSIGNSTAEDNPVKHVENSEASKTLQDINEEKAIVLYKPDAQPPQSNGTAGSEGNSKVQLLKVLETRKSMLQKEQGMAFARAVAAGFDIDDLPALMSFAECFGASRLMDAGKKFIDLWKRKHESGQWVEIEAAEAMRNHPDFSAVNESGIVFSNMAPASELDSLNNVKASAEMSPVDRQPSLGTPENDPGQFPHHMYPPWPIHSPPGTFPVFQPCPVQGIPYYQNYPGNSPYMQPIYPPMEDPRLNGSQSNGRRRHSMHGRYSHTESEMWDVDASKSDDMDMENQGSLTEERHKKGSRSSRQKSGKVVIRNINFITKTENSSGSGSCSDSASETDEDKDAQGSVKTSKRRGSSKESSKKLNSSDKEETDYGKDTDGVHWQAFQSCLLRDVDEDKNAFDQDQFELKRGDHMRRKRNVAGNDPLVFSERDISQIQGDDTIDIHSISRGLTHMPKASADELLLPGRLGQSGDRSVDDVQYSEIEGKRGVIRRTANDDFMILKQEGQSGNAHASSDLMAVNGLGYSNNNLERKLSHDVNDDSYIFEYRSTQVNDTANNERNAIDMDSEFPMMHQKAEKWSNEINYEPDELNLMPERNAESESIGYDPALDYEMQAQAIIGALQDNKNKEVSPDTKPGPKKLNKEQRSKITPNTADQRKPVGPIRRGKTSKLSPLDDARARAESLRNYKADLQKIKKQKEEEEIKRLEALKIERQKRIASRSGSTSTPSPSPSPSQQNKKQLPSKLSPSSHKGSKFSDSEPGLSSPLQRLPIRTVYVGSNDSSKTSKPGRLVTKSHSAENRLTRSVSSLPEAKEEKVDGATDTKASMARIRRLSEPKMSVTLHTSSVKPHGTGTTLKTMPVDVPERKKISAIVGHHKSKTATLSEVKIRTPKASETVQNRSITKEKAQKLNGNKSSVSSEGSLPKKNENEILPNDDGDDNPVVEKTVVMLECEKPSTHTIHVPEEKTDLPKIQYNNNKVTEKTETVSDHVAVCAPASQQSMDIVDRETTKSQSQLQPVNTEVKVDNIENVPSKSANTGVDEEAYRPPYARVSSLEDPCMENSDYGKAPPTSLENADNGVETVRAPVSDYRNSTLEKIPEAFEKPQVKESKGFRRLLKFGRKNHSSATGGRNVELDNVSIDGSEADEIGTNNSSNEVHTLKNLISRDETPTANTPPQKSSRSFSLLSPFRSKSSEKKVVMA